jgi:4-amino-4-deoxy-L-arabinose transferase-like glycosyltransferase
LLVAIGTGLLARLLWIAAAWWRRGTGGFLVPDSQAYLLLAQKLAAGEGFVDHNGQVELFRTPAYPLLLAIGSAMEHPVRFALLVQLLLSAGIIASTFLLARRTLADERLAAVCALLVAVEPTSLAWSLKVMPETLLTLLLVAFAYAALRALDTRRASWTAAAALAICAAAYVKPIAYPLVALLCVVSLARVRLAPAFIVTCVLLLAPWHLRNELRADYAGFSTLFARAAYLSAGGSVVAQREHRPYEEVRLELIDRADVRGEAGDPREYGRAGVSLIASDPFGYAKTHVKGMLRTLFDPGAAEFLRFLDVYREGGRARMAGGGIAATARAYPLAFWSSVVLAVILAPLVILPAIALYRAPNVVLLLFALIAAYLVTAGGGIPGYSRFRVPAVPLLIVMSAAAFDANRKLRRVAPIEAKAHGAESARAEGGATRAAGRAG